MKYLYLFAISFLLSAGIAAQDMSAYFLNDSIKVSLFGVERKHPWSGGFNLPMFSPIDLNKDGYDDLFVFDKSGERIYTFLNDGIQGTASYSYAPEYEKFFPDDLYDWALLRDFNCNGKLDIFTRNRQTGGVKLYRNTTSSSITDSLNFELVFNMMPAIKYGQNSFLTVRGGDKPAIYDVDGDGDLDVVTFNQFTTAATFFENISPTCDTMILEFNVECYGHFRENLTTNQIVLNDMSCQNLLVDPGGNDDPPVASDPGHQTPQRGARHKGGTLTAFDKENNGLTDLIVGDVAMPNMKAVFNGGTQDSAHMVSQDSTWPVETTPVNLPHQGAAYVIDVNNDGLDDIIVSPVFQEFELVHASEDVNNVWLYMNVGSQNNMELSFNRNNFINRHSIDHGTAAYPGIIDVDGDGLKDIVIGNMGKLDFYDEATSELKRTGQLGYYRNTGSRSVPEYEFVSDDFSGLSNYDMFGLFPDFADLNNNGSPEMIAGARDGTFNYFENNSPPGAPLNYQLSTSNYMNIQIDAYTFPALYDLNGDGLHDLITGTFNGVLYYFENKGTPTDPQFDSTPDKDTLGGMSYRTPGRPGAVRPYFAPFPTDTSEVKLILGTYLSKIYVYDIPSDPINDPYVLVDSITVKAKNPSPALANIGGDERMEMIYGHLTGGISYLQMHEHVEDTTTPGDTIIAGACCLPGDSCIQTTDSSCVAQGGEYFGDGTACDDPTVDCGSEDPADTTYAGACCLPDGSCVEVSDSACTAQSGEYYGDSTFCSDDTVQCDSVINTSSMLESPQSQIYVYPNPFEQTVRLNVSYTGGEEVYVRVFSITGETISEFKFGSDREEEFDKELDLSDLSNGIYLIMVDCNKTKATQKVIKR